MGLVLARVWVDQARWRSAQTKIEVEEADGSSKKESVSSSWRLRRTCVHYGNALLGGRCEDGNMDKRTAPGVGSRSLKCRHGDR